MSSSVPKEVQLIPSGELHEDHACCWVQHYHIEADGHRVGHIMVRYIEQSPYLEIWDIEILPEHRRGGYGAAAVAKLPELKDQLKRLHPELMANLGSSHDGVWAVVESVTRTTEAKSFWCKMQRQYAWLEIPGDITHEAGLTSKHQASQPDPASSFLLMISLAGLALATFVLALWLM